MKRLAFILIPLLLIFIIVILVLRFQTPPTPISETPIPTPVAEDPNDPAFLTITTIIPLQQTPFTRVSRNQEIQLIFNKPTSAESVVVSASPSLPLSTRQGESASDVYVSPTFPELWTPDITYTLTISKSTSSRDGKTMRRDRVYTLQSFTPVEPLIQE